MTETQDSPGPASRTSPWELSVGPPPEQWDDWVELDPAAWPRKVERHYRCIPTICFNCESACGLLAFVDKSTGKVQKFEGNPVHPGSRGRTCAKGPATINQVNDPDRILKPVRRKGARGSGEWEEVTWDQALDEIGARIRKALLEERHDEIMYHVGRPGEDHFVLRMLQAWGIDGHNSHTNVCSASARLGYSTWFGADRPSPDYTNNRFVLLLSAHLETGHYFNPHAQRIIDAKTAGSRIAVVDTRLSNTCTHAERWISPWPGTEGAMLLAVAHMLIVSRRFDEGFVRRWTNWEAYLEACDPGGAGTFERFIEKLTELYEEF
ncbi:MAG: molybdopterin-dependent oxidoreductase, partial [Planctomycetota bacterium]